MQTDSVISITMGLQRLQICFYKRPPWLPSIPQHNPVQLLDSHYKLTSTVTSTNYTHNTILSTSLNITAQTSTMAKSSVACLAALPVEIMQQVCKHLDLADVLSLRSTDIQRASMTIRPSTPLLASKLQRVQVLRTREGLLTLYGLLSVPEWRNCIQVIEFVDHGLYDIRRLSAGDNLLPSYSSDDEDDDDNYPDTDGDLAVSRWFAYSKLTNGDVARVRNAVGPAQLAFEDSDQAYIFLTKISAYLQQAEQLEVIHIGLKRW
jgi:hypothetical protein